MSSVISLQSNTQFAGNSAFYVDFHEFILNFRRFILDLKNIENEDFHLAL